MNKKVFNPYIPYSGCKQRLINKFCSLIKKYNSDANIFIDLFGGGGSATFFFVAKVIKLLITNIILVIIL